MAFYREMAKEDPDTYEPKVAEALHSLASLYGDDDRKESEQLFLEALDHYRRCSQRDPDTYEAELGMTLFVLGMIYHQNKHFITCEKYYLEAPVSRIQKNTPSSLINSMLR